MIQIEVYEGVKKKGAQLVVPANMSQQIMLVGEQIEIRNVTKGTLSFVVGRDV